MYDFDGEVVIDGSDINGIALPSLRKGVSIMTQVCLLTLTASCARVCGLVELVMIYSSHCFPLHLATNPLYSHSTLEPGS